MLCIEEEVKYVCRAKTIVWKGTVVVMMRKLHTWKRKRWEECSIVASPTKTCLQLFLSANF